MKNLKIIRVSVALVIIGLLIFVYLTSNPMPISKSEFDSLYSLPAENPETPLRVFHLGHSLVGHDMPSMLKQLAPADHDYRSQLGTGTTLKAHFDDRIEIQGFEISNNHSHFREVKEAIESGKFNTFVLTEMVELKDAIKYHDSFKYLHKWATQARTVNPKIRIYLYETWHNIDDSDGWLNRIDNDLSNLWEREILRRALGYDTEKKPVYVIPGGQVMARFVRKVEDMGGIGPINSRFDLFTDNIHFNDYGAYLMALTHYAVLYQKNPAGLPYKVFKADGNYANEVGPDVASLMQDIVWEVVTSYDKTGVPSNTQ